MHDKYTIKELWDIILNQPLVEAKRRHKERLRNKKERLNDKNSNRKSNK